MHRFLIGIVLLTVTLGLGIAVSAAFPGLHKPIDEDLGIALSAAAQGNWKSALDAMDRAVDHWRNRRSLIAAVSDHEPMESIDIGFAQALAFLQQKEEKEFCAAVAALRQTVAAMANSQSIVWWHFL